MRHPNRSRRPRAQRTSLRRFARRTATLALLCSPLSAHAVEPVDLGLGDAPNPGWSILFEDVAQVPDTLGQNFIEQFSFAPGGSEAYVAMRNGFVYRTDLGVPNPAFTLTLNLATVFPAALDSDDTGFSTNGLKALALHPEFHNPAAPGYRKLYTAHGRMRDSGSYFQPGVTPVIFPAVSGSNRDIAIAEWTVDAQGDVIPRSYREVMQLRDSREGVSKLAFNPVAQPGDDDYGLLYIATAGSSTDSQNVNTTAGSILRVNPLLDGSNPFSLPSTPNPLAVDSSLHDPRNLTYAYGIGKARQLDWSPEDGRLRFVDGHLSLGSFGEINLGEPGANYGYGDRVGTFVRQGFNAFDAEPLPADHPTDPYTYPVAQYFGSDARPTGVTYAGANIPELAGLFVLAENTAGVDDRSLLAVETDALTQRDDFTNLASIHGGRLAPYQSVGFLHVDAEGQPTDTPIQFAKSRLATGSDGELYLFEGFTGWVRRAVGVIGLNPGDANRDGVVDLLDFDRLAQNFGAAGEWGDADFNHDGVVDLLDFDALAQSYGAAAPATVPEPASALVVGAGLATLRRRRPRVA